MTSSPQQQAAADEEQLRLLAIFYFVYGGLTGAFSLLALSFAFVGLVLGGARHAAWWGLPPDQAAAAITGCVLVALGSCFFVLLGTTAALRILVGFALRRHRYYVLCLVAAGLTCLEIPLGAALGIATLIVLMRPSVERLFSGQPPLPPPEIAPQPQEIASSLPDVAPPP